MIILPSLEIVPAKFNGNILLSQIPVNGAGDFTVSRALNTATRINSLGNIEAVNADTPRIDYLTSSGTVGCPALLVEPSVSNSMLYSQAINSWTKSGLTITDNFAISPDGTQNASYIQQTSGGTIVNLQSAGVSLVSGQAQSVTFFAKAAEITSLTLRFGTTSLWAGSVRPQFTFNLINGSITMNAGTATVSSQSVGNGWYRYSIVTPATIASGQTTIQTVTNTVFSPNSGDGFYLWGVQWEQNTSTPTSYIPTTTAAVTRNADVVSVSGAVSGSIGQTQGTIYAEVDIRNMAKETHLIRIDDGATANVITLRTLTSNLIRTAITAPTTSGTINISSAAFTAGIVKIAFAYKSGEIALSVNGATALTANGTFAFGASLNRITLGSNAAASSEFNDRIRALALYTTRLTNTQLAALTTP